MGYCVAVLLCLVGWVTARPKYQSLIPNGAAVPNPCLDPAVWNPVGHYNPTHHTLLKNPFAKDFKDNNYTWTKALCQMDSDQDHHTNGVELGDPNCVWTVGAKPEHPPTGHPGICEPVGSHRCHYQHFRCDCLENCPGLVNSIP